MHVLASSLHAQGPAYPVTWGSNQYGQCDVHVQYGGLVKVTAGARHSAVLNLAGGLMMGGDNTFGQCDVPPEHRWDDVALGDGHSVALTGSGVHCWGRNSEGQCNVPLGIGSAKAVSAGAYHSLAVTHDGRVAVWGAGWFSDPPKQIQGRVLAVDGGLGSSLVLLDDGTVKLWQYGWSWEGDVPPKLTGVTAVAAGYDFSLALREDGSIRAWGSNQHGQCNVPPGTFTRIDAGAHHAVALTPDGRAVAWGLNSSGQASPPHWKGWAGFKLDSIAAGESHSIASGRGLPPTGPPYSVLVSPLWPASIQQLVDTAPEGRPIQLLLRPGTYTFTGLAFLVSLNRSVELVGIDGPGSTFIDGEGMRRGIVSLGDQGSLTVRGITFTRCHGMAIQNPLFTDGSGGSAILARFGTAFVVENCRFLDCVGEVPAGAIVYTAWRPIYGGSPPDPVPPIRITDCHFERCGRGVSLAAWGARVESCTFRECQGVRYGGALFGMGVTIESCRFEANRGGDFGGAVCLLDETSRVNNCEFIGNSGDRGGAMYIQGGSQYYGRHLVTNCTFIENWTPNPDQWSSRGGGAIGYASGTDFDNCTFVGNSSLYGRVIGRADGCGWQQPRFTNCTFDTCCPVWPPDCVEWGPGNSYEPQCLDCLGDVECSGMVDGVDLGILLSRWGPAPPDDDADVNADGAVDGIDLGLLLADWGLCPQG